MGSLLGCCSTSATHDFGADVSIRPELKIKIVTSIQQCIDKGDRSWPEGLPHTQLLQCLAFDSDDSPRSDYPEDWSNTITNLRNNIIATFEKALESRKAPPFSNYLTFALSQPTHKFVSEIDADKKHKAYKETIVTILETEYFNDNNENIGVYHNETKQFITFLLSYCLFDSNSPYDEYGRNDPDFLRLKQISTDILIILQIRLIDEYERICECKSKYDQPLIELEYKQSGYQYADIKSQRDLYPDFTNFSKNLACRTKVNHNIIFRIDYDDCIEQFRKHKLPHPDIIPNIWSDIEGNVYKKDINIEFFRQIASIINPLFQEEMKTLFDQNRAGYKQKIGDEFKHDDDATFNSAPIETNGSATAKIAEEDPQPQCGSILDWVRCTFVMYDTMELMMLYETLLKKYNNGEIIRVNNEYLKGTDGNYGYRVLMMHVVYEAKGFKMIVEIELVLLEYVKAKKKMQFFSKIVKAKDCLQLAADISRVIDIDKTKSKPWFVLIGD